MLSLDASAYQHSGIPVCLHINALILQRQTHTEGQHRNWFMPVLYTGINIIQTANDVLIPDLSPLKNHTSKMGFFLFQASIGFY